MKMSAGVISVPTIVPLRVPVAGKPKNYIDTNTLIELKTDTQGATVYYTVDNTRPDTIKRLGGNTTLLYTEPFMLHSGKRTVKALAQHKKDLRESNVVTKTFTVEYAEPEYNSQEDDVDDDNDENFQLNMSRGNSVMSNNITTSIIEGKNMGVQEAWHNPFVPELKGLNAAVSDHRSNNIVQPNIHKNADAKRCVYCDAARPLHSKARFCSDCGKPVPLESELHDIEPSSMGMCTSCRSYVPLNQTMCIVCEVPIKQNKPQVSIRYQDHIICGSCEKQNPAHMTHCTYCEHRFPQAVHSGEISAPLPKLDARLIRCPQCARVNNPDARFCDWCGAKPTHEKQPMVCSLCKCNNPAYSRYCANCGSTFAPPDRIDPRNSDLADPQAYKDLPMWRDTPYPQIPQQLPGTRMVSAPRVRKKSVNTQTVGLFFPGGKKIHREQEESLEMQNREFRMSDKNPPLTAISPGRGYWRKQLDHICGHVKAYTTNNVEFRSVIGDPRIGKVVGAGIDERENDITVSFTFHLFENNTASEKPLQRDIYAQHKQFAFGSTLKEEKENQDNTKNQKKKKKLKKKTTLSNDKSKPEDRLLIKELSKQGSGRVSEVKQLIMEGANVNCCDTGTSTTALASAVENNRMDCVKALVNAGADVNSVSGVNSNTALHEAVKLGPAGKNMVQFLLDNKANVSAKNKKGLTAYDLALKSDYNSVVALFATHMGKNLTAKFSTPKGYKKKTLTASESEDEINAF